MANNAVQCQLEAEQSLARIIDEDINNLNNFVFNHASEIDILVAKAFISFSIAVHYSI